MFVNAVCGLFLGCLVVTAAIMPGVMRFAHFIDAVDRGGYRKVFRGEMPLLGGLGIALPFIALNLAAGLAGHVVIHNWQWVWHNHREWFNALFSLAAIRYDCITMAIGAAAIIALGLIDDTKGLRAKKKLLGQIAVALFMCWSGYVLTTVNIPFWGTVELGVVLGGLLTMLWIVGLINAFNLIDGIDGLAGGIALVGAAALVALSLIQENPYTTFIGVALAGSLLAFLFFNFPPAKVFLGDTGSMFLGYALAMTSLMGAQKTEAAVIILAPMLALSLPIFETLVSILRRYIGGVPVFTGDNRHTHHRLLRKGYSQPRVVLTLCGTALVLAAAAVLSALAPQNSTWAWFSYALYLGGLLYVAWLAGYLQPTALKTVLERRQRNKIFQALGRYAALRLNADDLRSSKTGLLLDLCRHELGLRYIDVRIQGGARLMVSPDDVKFGKDHVPQEEIHVKSMGAQDDILVGYEFKHAPSPLRRQDVSLCLASIFEGMRINRGIRPREVAHVLSSESYRAEVTGFGVPGKQGAQK